jgi:hypothetical protein
MAALRQYDGVFRNNFMRQVDSLAKTPQQKLLAIFDVAEGWFSQKIFSAVCLLMPSVSIPKKTRLFEIFASNLSG